MNWELLIFSIVGIFIGVTEWVLIASVLKLRKEIKKMNDNMQSYFGELQNKVKGLVDLFILVQTKKLKEEVKEKWDIL